MSDQGGRNRGEAYEEFDDIPLNRHLDATLGSVLMRRYGRRDAIKGLLAVSAASLLFGHAPDPAEAQQTKTAQSRFRFAEALNGVATDHHLAQDHEAQVLLRWGDPVFADSAPFDPHNQSMQSQLTQFGYNNDFIGFLPLNETGSRALLCVNHEFTNEEVMFPGVGVQHDKDFIDMTRDLVDIEMAAHGGTIIEIAFSDATWRPVLDSRFNRRITAASTEMTVDGPAAAHPRLVTTADPSGKRVIGTLNNCAGGMTPWGTYLMAEENFHGYFWTEQHGKTGMRMKSGLGGARQVSYERYGIPGGWYNWGRYHDRFNVDLEPNEPNRFGWVVEVDPTDPGSTPVKHTALGRFRHEGAECTLSANGRAVVFMGDDARFDYLYRFVSDAAFEPGDKAANMSLLSSGTLSVARFDSDGSVKWLPLRFGDGPLTPEYGFESQADVLIDARLAADALGATPMDRPEDVQTNPRNNRVYVMLTNNKKRTAKQVDAANPRAHNWPGHIIEMTPPDGDYEAEVFAWDILVKCGNPDVASVGATWNPQTSSHGWFAAPDNCATDDQGRLWIASNQGKHWHRTGTADGLYGLETDGALRGYSRLFYRCPVGAELCGPCFAPDGETLFVAIQHPGTDGTHHFKGFERQSTFEDPATRWPDFDLDMPPRPAVLAIRRKGGGPVGG